MNDFNLFSLFKKKRTKNRRRPLAIAVSLLAHLLFFGLLVLLNPSFRFEVSPFKSVRTVYLSSPLNLPLLEINNLLPLSSRLISSPEPSPAASAPSPEKAPSNRINSGPIKPAARPSPTTAEAKQLTSPSQSTPEMASESQSPSFPPTPYFTLKAFPPPNHPPGTETNAYPSNLPQSYNFSVIPKGIPDEFPWLMKDRYLSSFTTPNSNQKITSQLLASAGLTPSSSPINLETIALPPSALLYDPQLLSSWAKIVVVNLQKKLLELIPHQFHQLRPAQIRVEVDRTGQLLALQISQSSGDSLLDDSLVRTIRISQPFPALPPSFPEERLLFQLVFQANEK